MDALCGSKLDDLFTRVSMSVKDGQVTYDLWLLVNEQSGNIEQIGRAMFSKEGCVNIRAEAKKPLDGNKYTIEVTDSMSLLSEEVREKLLNTIIEFNS